MFVVKILNFQDYGAFLEIFRFFDDFERIFQGFLVIFVVKILNFSRYWRIVGDFGRFFKILTRNLRSFVVKILNFQDSGGFLGIFQDFNKKFQNFRVRRSWIFKILEVSWRFSGFRWFQKNFSIIFQDFNEKFQDFCGIDPEFLRFWRFLEDYQDFWWFQKDFSRIFFGFCGKRSEIYQDSGGFFRILSGSKRFHWWNLIGNDFNTWNRLSIYTLNHQLKIVNCELLLCGS